MNRAKDDLISRAAAIAAFDDERVDRYYGDVSPESVIKVIESIPAVDVAPVVHGLWIDFNFVGNRRYQCSECFHWVNAGTDRNYCPNCGAKMEN